MGVQRVGQPHDRRSEAPTSVSTGPLSPSTQTTTPTAAAAASEPASSTQDFRPLIAFSAALGFTVLLILGLFGYAFWRRRSVRRSAEARYHVARDRDPSLTWFEYERRCKLSRSTIMMEEETQRAVMIRKSLQSKSAVNVAGTPTNSSVPNLPALPSPPPPLPASVAAPPSPTTPIPADFPTPPSPPPRSRVRTWPLRERVSFRRNLSVDDKEMLLGGGGAEDEDEEEDLALGPLRSPNGSLELKRRSLQQQRPGRDATRSRAATGTAAALWELPDGKKCPPAWGNFPWNGKVRDAPPVVPPPSMRTKTPPLWTHPAFRSASMSDAGGKSVGSGAGLGVSKKSLVNDLGLLPSELTKVKPASTP